jgi:uncharacterized protein (DUF1501 family)
MTTTWNTNPKGLTRRNALRTLGGGCAAMTQTSLLSTLLTLNLTRAASAAIDTSGYKAMVCCFLHGGIDSHNVLVPIGIDDIGTDYTPYNDYVAARSTLALPYDPALPIPGLHEITDLMDGRFYGLHPGLADLQQLYNDQNLAFIANVGALVEPVGDASSYRDFRLPLGLMSHSDQQRHWQTSTPQSRTQITGWAGRMADVLDDLTNRNTAIPMNIAVDYINIFQTGDTIVPYVVDDQNGAEVFAANHSGNPADLILASATNSFLDQTYSDLVKRTFADLNAQAIEAAENYNLFTNAVTTAPADRDPPDSLPDIPYLNPAITNVLENQTGHIGRQLLQVAKAIGAHVGLDQDRQVFFVERHGWDHHTNLIANQGNMVPELGRALSAFYAATADFGLADDVVTFTASDFARTLGANSNVGSDHAWGANHIAMGGGVHGGRIFGTYPASLAPGNSLDIGRGRLVPTTSVDEFIADLVLWFGMENDNVLETIIPNIRNFYASSETTPPLGLMTPPVP